MKVIVQFALFCFFLLAAALVDGIVMAVRLRRLPETLAPEILV